MTFYRLKEQCSKFTTSNSSLESLYNVSPRFATNKEDTSSSDDLKTKHILPHSNSDPSISEDRTQVFYNDFNSS